MEGNSRLKDRFAGAIVVTAALVVAIAVLAAPASDAKKKKSCKKGKEKSGCTLKAGQGYGGAAGGGPRVHLIVTASSNGLQVKLIGGLECVKGASERQVHFQQSAASGKPKIGKSYNVTFTQPGGSNSQGTITETLAGKVTLSSAKKASADLTYKNTVGPTTDCNVKVPAPSLARF